MLDITIRPISKWPGTENAKPKSSPFRSTYSTTMEQLEKELNEAGVVTSSVIVEMFVSKKQLTLDGTRLRSHTKPDKPGIILRFSRYSGKSIRREDGTVTRPTQDVSYPCDAFTSWEDNLRAVTLSLESLRRVERYGVFKYDEIISRLALPSAEGRSTSREDAAAFIAQHSGFAMADILTDVNTKAAAYKKAAIALHPDRGGDNETFIKLQESLKTLQA